MPQELGQLHIKENLKYNHQSGVFKHTSLLLLIAYLIFFAGTLLKAQGRCGIVKYITGATVNGVIKCFFLSYHIGK
jgi:hypothetical protein